MKAIISVISEYIAERKMDVKEVAELCGWTESRLVSILCGNKKLSAGDYGTLCDALGITYDVLYKRSQGVNANF